MRFSMLPAVALLAASTSALAQMPPPRHYDNRADVGDSAIHPADADSANADGPGNGLQLELNVLREAAAYSTNALLFTTTTGSGSTGSYSGLSGFINTLQPLASIGYQWDQNAVLLGVGIAVTGGVGGSGSTLFFSITPTYRRYMSPLRTGKIIPFAEGAVTISLVSIPGSTFGGTTTSGYSDLGLGVAFNVGAEWLFVKNFGLFGKVGVDYGHLSLNSGPSPSPSQNLDEAGVQGDVGLAVHL